MTKADAPRVCCSCGWYWGGEIAGRCVCPDIPGTDQWCGLPRLAEEECPTKPSHWKDCMRAEDVVPDDHVPYLE